MKNIVVIGAGFVGLSMAFLLDQYHNVTILDVDQKKVDNLNAGILPIVDPDMETRKIPHATTDYSIVKNADFVIVAGPSDLNKITRQFDTTILENILIDIEINNPKVPIIIKSTVPIGFTELQSSMINNPILFSPEFLREGSALYDNLYPTRIIVGGRRDIADEYLNMILGCVQNQPETAIIGTTEAEAVKLFSNAYLAMRVAFFNELDSFALHKGLNTKQIIDGVCADPRIGKGYNNPSFGYGGYCLPKDSMQLYQQSYEDNNELLYAIVDSNEGRKWVIGSEIVNICKGLKLKEIGIYRLVMKEGSDNFRSSAILTIINMIKDDCGIRVKIYEPTINECEYGELVSLEELKTLPLIIANRFSDDLIDVKEKVFTRDIYKRD